MDTKKEKRQSNLASFFKKPQVTKEPTEQEGGVSSKQKEKSKSQSPQRPKLTPKKRKLDEIDDHAEEQLSGKKSLKISKVEKKSAQKQKEEEKVPQVVNPFAETKGGDYTAANSDPLETIDTFIDALGDWKEPMSRATEGAEFKILFNYVKREYNMDSNPCFPPRHQIFNAYQQAKFKDIKVVVVGQDPYIKPGEAMGMSFSVNKGIKVPPSLLQIYKALERDPDIDGFSRPSPPHGDLTAWAKQGIFLLNAVLTVRAGKSNSHQKKGWEAFTKETIRQINKNCENVVYMLWGKKAHDTAVLVNKTKNLVIIETHPSPLAGQGFVDSKCFSQCNKYLKDNGKTPIDWTL